jgi:hypothetical protein
LVLRNISLERLENRRGTGRNLANPAELGVFRAAVAESGTADEDSEASVGRR